LPNLNIKKRYYKFGQKDRMTHMNEKILSEMCL